MSERNQNSPERPNIILLMPTSLRYDCIGAFGNEVIRTPSIDRLAEKGTKFTNCFLQNSISSQSRCSIFTAKYERANGKRPRTGVLHGSEPNVLKTLKADGYHIAVLASKDLLFNKDAAESSIDEYGCVKGSEKKFVIHPVSKSPSDGTTLSFWESLFSIFNGDDDPVENYDEALILAAERWLDEPPKDKPWALLLPLGLSCNPLGVEEPYFSMYDRADVPKPLHAEDKTGYEPKFMDASRKLYKTDQVSDEEWSEVVANYYGMISKLDDQIGRILNKLESSSYKNMTYTFFLTDHGDFLGDHGMIDNWPSGVNTALIHAPLIISGPKIPKNKTVGSLCEMIDVGPTLFALCGIKEDSFLPDGKSLIPLIEGDEKQKNTHRDFVVSLGGIFETERSIIDCEHRVNLGTTQNDVILMGRVMTLRDEKFTYVYRSHEPEELYNSVNDPSELHNLAHLPEYQEVVRKYSRTLLEWIFKVSGEREFFDESKFSTQPGQHEFTATIVEA